MGETNDVWNTISYVISGELRLKILLLLAKTPTTPTMLSDTLKVPISRVSLTLKELMDVGAIECLTPDRRKGRIYRTTAKGKKIIEEIHRMTAL